mgnify:CR=1 FL=1
MIDAALRKIEFYVPESHLEKVKSAIFQAGAGRVGQYDNCAWQTLGQGQYRPLEDSDPFVGEKGVIEIVEEYKVEVVCKLEYLFAVIEAMKASHPYDEVAYSVIKLEIGS